MILLLEYILEYVYSPFTAPLQSLYSPFAVSLQSLYSPFTVPLQSFYSPFTVPLLSLYSPFTVPLQSLYSPFTVPDILKYKVVFILSLTNLEAFLSKISKRVSYFYLRSLKLVLSFV